MTAKVSVVVGNPNPRSRTLQIATGLVERLFAPGEVETTVIDLAEVDDQIFTWPSERVAALSTTVAESDLVVFASPTYKATYTGLLKAFLDRYPSNGLSGVVAIPLLTGADPAHSMGATHTLAPLLAELGAIVPGRGLYFVVSQLDRLGDILDAAAAEYRGNLARLAHVAEHTRIPAVIAAG